MEVIHYPFKTTSQTKINESFRKHIISKYGGVELFQAFEKAFKLINELREQLNFSSVNTSNIQQCENMESTIYKYLKYAMQLQKKFKFESWQPDRVNINFDWSDSFRQKEVITKTSNLRVEMCAILYNLVVLLYYTGNEYMRQNSLESRKTAIKKFRYAIWAISELKKNLPSIIREFRKIHLDFTVQNISIFENILYGLTYSCLFLNLEPAEQNIGTQHLACLAGEANKHFQHALRITFEVFNDPNLSFSKTFLQEVKEFLYSNTVYYFSLTAFKMAKYHESRLEIEIRLQHMGHAIAYLTKALEILQTTLNSIDHISPMKKQKIEELAKIIHKKYQELTLKNQQIYNQPIVNAKDLVATQLTDKQRITPVMPSDLEKETDDEQWFRNLLSPDIIQLLKDVKKISTNNKTGIVERIKNLKEERNSRYLSNFVNGYLEILHQSVYCKQNKPQEGQRRQLPDTIAQKIIEIDKKGGEQEIIRLIMVLEENFTNSQNLLQESLDKLKQEMKTDIELRQIYQGKWDVTSSSEANKEYLKDIDDLQDNLTEAKHLDQESKVAFEDLAFYFDLIKQGPEYIISKIPVAQDQEFADFFLEKITQINQLDSQVVSIIKNSENKTEQITDCLKYVDMSKILATAADKKLDKQKTIQFIITESVGICDSLAFDIANANSMIDEICNIAEFLNSQKMDSKAQDSIKEIEKVNNGFCKILELYSELEQGIDFYQALLDKSAQQDEEISDYVTSRQQLFENQKYLIESKERNFQPCGDGYVTAQPFFGDGGFPQGNSVYIQPNSFVGQSSELERKW